jgi:hypothetical protein
MIDTKYPKCKVQLVGRDGNAFAILGRVGHALKDHLRKSGLPPEEITAEIARFNTEATSGDYNHLLQTCMKWVDAR